MTESEPNWKCVKRHELTGREIYQRTVSFRVSGNNEGSMEDEIEVREADGTPLLETSVRIEWEYYGYVQVDFTRNGMEVHVSGTNKETEVHNFPPVAAKT